MIIRHNSQVFAEPVCIAIPALFPESKGENLLLPDDFNATRSRLRKLTRKNCHTLSGHQKIQKSDFTKDLSTNIQATDIRKCNYLNKLDFQEVILMTLYELESKATITFQLLTAALDHLLSHFFLREKVKGGSF